MRSTVHVLYAAHGARCWASPCRLLARQWLRLDGICAELLACASCVPAQLVAYAAAARATGAPRERGFGVDVASATCVAMGHASLVGLVPQDGAPDQLRYLRDERVA